MAETAQGKGILNVLRVSGNGWQMERRRKKSHILLSMSSSWDAGCQRGAKMGTEMVAQGHWHPKHFDASLSHAWREMGDGSGVGSSLALVPSLALWEQIRAGRGEVSFSFPLWRKPTLSASLSQAGIFPRNGFSRS